MKLHLLGSAAGKPVPRPFCRCRACQIARQNGGKNYRTRISMHIYLNGQGPSAVKYKIDLPPDTAHHVIRDNLNLTTLEHLLITHAHQDHLYMHYLEARASVTSKILPLNIWANQETFDYLAEQSLDFNSTRIIPHIVKPGDRFSAGELEVLALKTLHSPKAPCLNFVISAEGKLVLFAWDTGYWPRETFVAVKGSKFDAVFMECTVNSPKGESLGSCHHNFETFIGMKQEMARQGLIDNTTPFISVHMGDNGRISHDEAQNLMAKHNATAGYDGLTLEL